MTKGEDTRQRILERAAPLLNRHGFGTAPVSQIMRVTGLQKGGLYNHFASKEELALATFDHVMAQINRRVQEVHASRSSPLEQLLAHIELICSGHTVLEGGCPILNSIVESDDANPALRERVRAVVDRWRRYLARVVADGIVRGEIRADVNPDEVATLMIGMFEGAHLLSNFYRDEVYRRRMAEHLTAYVNGALRASA